MLFGLQGDYAVTPNGEIYFPKKHWLQDFSQGEDWQKFWFIHEMVHVWQKQLGYWVTLRGAIRIGLDYKYELDNYRKLSDYNMEAQGDLIGDYFYMEILGKPNALRMKHYSIKDLSLYKKALSLFIASPSDKRNLPGNFDPNPHFFREGE
jgi:hypothetical protein